MKTLFVLVILSGAPGPTWTVSAPVTEETCKAMHQAVLDAADNFNKEYSTWLPQQVYPPRSISCQQLNHGVRSENPD